MIMFPFFPSGGGGLTWKEMIVCTICAVIFFWALWTIMDWVLGSSLSYNESKTLLEVINGQIEFVSKLRVW